MPRQPRATGERLSELERERGVVPKAAYRCRHHKVNITLGEHGPDSIKAIREQLSCSQGILAAFLGVKTRTVGGWEQGRHKPPGIARRFLDMIQADPDYWRERLREVMTETPRKTPCETVQLEDDRREYQRSESSSTNAGSNSNGETETDSSSRQPQAA